MSEMNHSQKAEFEAILQFNYGFKFNFRRKLWEIPKYTIEITKNIRVVNRRSLEVMYFSRPESVIDFINNNQ